MPLSVIAVRYGRVPKRSKGGDGIKKENGDGSEEVGLSPEQQMEERAREEKNIAIYDIVLKVTQVTPAPFPSTFPLLHCTLLNSRR